MKKCYHDGQWIGHKLGLQLSQRACAFMLAAAASVGIACGTARAVDIPEIEPNNSKPTAQVVNRGGLGLDAGDTITGSTTGQSTSTAGPASADYFVVTTRARPLGIYRYRLAFTSTTPGHTITIRGLTQTAGSINPGTDAGMQTHSTTLVTGARTIQWYGFGRQERMFVKVTGTAATTANYVGTLSVDTVTPTEISGIVDGSVTIKEGAGTAANVDTDFMVYDASLSPIPGYRWDNGDAAGLTAEFVANTYYVLWGNFNTADNQPSPTGDLNQTATVLDSPDAVINTSTLNITSHVMSITTDAGESTTDFARSSAFDVNFARVVMAVNNIPLPPVCTSTFETSPILNDGSGTYTLNVSIEPGRRPASVSHVVTVDLGLLGDTRPQPVELTQTSPTTFTVSGTVADGTAPGPYQLTVNVTETSPQNRNSTCLQNLTVVSPPTGACCIANTCVIETERNCGNQGGVYQGNGVTCTGCTCASTETPANSTPETAVLMSVGGTYIGNSCAATIADIPSCSGQAPTRGALWYKFVGTGSIVSIDTCASPADTGYNTRISVLCGTPGSFTCVAGNDNSCGTRSRVDFCTQNIAEYYVVVHGNGADGDFVLTFSDTGAGCTPAVTCIPTGGCCLSDSCQDVTEAACTTLGGTFLGLGTPCVTRTQNPAFSATDLPIAISDNTVSTSTLVVPANSGTISGGLVVSVGLTHTYIGDLIATVSNGTASARLFSRAGGTAELGGTYVFEDGAPAGLITATGTAALIEPGTYAPLDTLTVFDGQPYEGTWTLTVADQAGADVGFINEFTLVQVTVTPNCGGTGCSPCVADYNQDGGVDGGDLSAFFPDWQDSLPCADVNADGGVDGGDVESFFNEWVTGAC